MTRGVRPICCDALRSNLYMSRCCYHMFFLKLAGICLNVFISSSRYGYAALVEYPMTMDNAGIISEVSTIKHVSVLGQPGGYSEATNNRIQHYAGFAALDFTVRPDEEASNLITYAQALDVTLSWESGNGAGHLVVMREGSPVTWMPEDGMEYTATNDYSHAIDQGSGNKVVGSSSSTNLAVNGLIPETTYYVSIFEYNGGSADTLYLTNGIPLNGFATTLSQPSMMLTPTTLTYVATYNGTDPLSQTVVISNQGEMAYTYTNNVSYSAGTGAWFAFSGMTGTVFGLSGHTHTASVSIAGINSGTYWATNIFDAPVATNSPQSVIVSLTVNKADQEITFPPISDQITTSSVQLTATSTSGLQVAFAVLSGPGSIAGGTNLTFTTEGSVSILASQAGDTNWNVASDVTNTFNVTKAFASVSFTNLTQVYDGTQKNATCQTSPTGLTVNVLYDGGTNLPVNVGSYTVVGVVDEPMYRGGLTNTLEITKAPQTITFSNPGDQVWTNAVGLSGGASSGLPVSFAVQSGRAVINGGTNVSFTGYGAVSIVGSQAGNTNYLAAPSVTNSFQVSGALLTMLGTNGQFIVSDSVPISTNGTKFVDTFLWYPAHTNIFTITNTGNAELSISSVTNYGSTSMAFRIVSYPTNIPVGSSTSCAIALDTEVIGIHTAQVVFAFNGTNSPYRLNLEGRVDPDVMSIYMPTQSVDGIERNIFSRYDWTVLQALTDLRDILNQTNEAGIIVRFDGYPGYDPAFTNGNVSRLENDLNYLLDVFPLAGALTFAATNNVGYETFIDQYGNHFTTDEPWLFEPLPYTNTYTVILEAGRHTAAAGILDILENVELVTRYNRIQILASDNTRTQTISFAAIPDPTYPDTVSLSATAESGLPVSFTNLVGSPVVWQSGTSVTFNATGEVFIVASQTGNVNYLSAPDVTNAFAVQKGAQTISFPNPGDKITTNIVGLVASASSSLGVVFSVGTGPGIISDGTNLSFTTEGNVRVVASQAGDSYWHAASDVTNSINVAKVVAAVTLTNLSQVYDGTSKSPTSQTSPTGLTVNLTFDGSTNAPVNVATYIVAGVVDDLMYRGGTTNTLEITKASQMISFPNPGTQIMTNTVGLTAMGGGSDNTIIFALVSGPASLSGATNLSFDNSGVVTLTADQAGNSNYLAAVTVTNSFTVNPAIPVVGSLTVSNIYAHVAMLGGTVIATNGATILERGVYVSLTNGFDPQTGMKFSEIGSFGEVAYSVNGSNLIAGTTHYFVAFARNSAGECYSSQSSFLTKPDAPVALAESNVMLGQFDANWVVAVGATNYYLDVSMTNSFESYVGSYSNLSVGDVTTWPVTGLGTLPSYFYRVRAENATGLSTNSNIREAFMMMKFVVSANPVEHDTPLPYGYSTNYILYGTVITNSVTSPADTSNETRYVCSGWSGNGAVPVTGTNLSFICAVTTASEVVWQWDTQHYLDLSVNHGIITGAMDGWKYEGWVYDLVAVPDSGYIFNYWDVDGFNQGNRQLLTITTDVPHDVTAMISSAAWDLSETGTCSLASWRLDGKWFYIYVNLCNPSTSRKRYITKFIFAVPHPLWTYFPPPEGRNPYGEVYWDRTAQVIGTLGRDYLLPGECVTIGELGIYNPPSFVFDGKFYSKGEPVMTGRDTDQDGMPNAYEDGEGLNEHNPIDAEEDQDDDNMVALHEYIADTDPFDANSFLGIIAISNLLTGESIEWQGGVNAIQYLDWAPTINGPWTCILTNTPPTPVTNNYNNILVTYTNGFYRVRAVR